MTDIKLPKIALGAWAWGNDGTFGDGIDPDELKPVFEAAMDAGLNLWDTAYAYGMGASEKTLGGFLEGRERNSYLVSDKLTPQCMDAGTEEPVEDVGDMLEMQLALTGLDRFDIYWVHNPLNAPLWIRAVAEYFDGRDDAPIIGVSNHNLAEIKQADEILREHGLRVGAVQNHLSIINRSSIDSGILDWCKENDAVFFSYMVLEQGALTGRFDTEHPMPEGSARAQAYNPVLDKLEVINAKLAEIAQAHNAEAAQVPVAWAIAKGTLPIVGVTKEHHVADAVAATTLDLSEAEIRELEELADTLGIDAIRFWEKVMD